MKQLLRYPKNLWILAIGMMINITGSSFLWPLNSIYMTQELGQTLSIAGVVLMLHAGAGIFGNILGGALYDRIGGKWTILIGVLIGTACALSMAFFHQFAVYVILMILLGFGNGIVFPAIYAMAGGVWPEGGRKSFNVIYVSQNLGVAVGSALGGIVAQVSFTLVFLVNGLSFLLFFAIVWFGISEKLAVQPRGKMVEKTREDHHQQRKAVNRGMVSLSILTLGFMSCWLAYVQWQTSISVYMQDLGFSLSAYSLLWTINGLIIILAQPLVGLITERLLTTVRSQLFVGIIIFILSLAVLSQTEIYSGFMMAMIIMTIGEIFIWPAVPTAAHELAPKGRSGFFQGVVGSSATAGRMLGPWVGGMLFESYGPQTLFYVMIAVCFLSFICFTTYQQVMKRDKATPTDVSA